MRRKSEQDCKGVLYGIGEEAMPEAQLTLTSQKLKTPHAAAIAGILFAVLFCSSVVLIRLSIPANPACGSRKEAKQLLWH
jgi:hypothetical protein